MVARRSLTPTLGAELKRLKASTEKTSTRPHGHKIMGPDAALEVFDGAGNIAVRLSPTGSYFTGTIEIKSGGSSLKAFDAAGVETLNLNGTTNVIVGMLRTAVTGQPQVVVQPAGPSWNGKDLAVWFSPDGGTPGLGSTDGYVAGMWMTTVPNLGTPVPLQLRGQSGAGATLWGDLTLRPTGGVATGNIKASAGYSMDVEAESVALKSTNGRLYLFGTQALRVATLNGGGGYNTTSSGPANMHIGTDGVVYRSTSSRRYKTDIREYTPNPAWLDIPVVEWADKAALAEAAAIPADAPRPLTLQQQTVLDRANARHVGTLAEDAQAAAPRQIIRNAAGEVDGYAYDRDGAILRHFVRGHRDRLNALEARLTALEAVAVTKPEGTPYVRP